MFCKTENGWQIQAFLPRSISPADRMNLLEWFRSYRSEVQLLHPSWLTLFKATDRAYFLDVIPVQNPRHMALQDGSGRPGMGTARTQLWPDSNGKPNESELEAEDSPEDNSSDLQILPKSNPT